MVACAGKHLNSNMFCAIDIETTGLDVDQHEIIQIACIPLDEKLEPSKIHPIFDIKMIPSKIKEIDLNALTVSKRTIKEVCTNGIAQSRGVELFEHWFMNLGLPFGKKIIPVGYNVSQFDMPFIQRWLGWNTCNDFIFGHCRDAMTVCCYLNDMADVKIEQYPFSELKLISVANALGVEVFKSETHDALYDAMISAKVYKKLLHHHLVEGL